MKVLLLKDVYKLGRAGDVKRVANGYGRNYLLPQQLAVLATPGAMKQVEHIRTQAALRRNELNTELSSVADQVNGFIVVFASKAGETGKLYGSITPQMVADSINQKLKTNIDRHQIEIQPIRTLGEFKAHIRLTVDLTPEVKIIVHREGEIPASLAETIAAEKPKPVAEPAAKKEPEEEAKVEPEEEAEEEPAEAVDDETAEEETDA